MIKNYLKIAWRNLKRNRVYSLVNILGLAIGMTACFLIFQYVYFESGYDRFHKNADNLYRVPISFSGSFASNGTIAPNEPALGPAMKAEFPEVEDFTRLVHSSIFMSACSVTYDDEKGNKTIFNEDKVFIADPSFLTMFSYPLIAGDPATALTAGNAVVISEDIAKKYFGKENAMGKTLLLNGDGMDKGPSKVTGVFKSPPQNSHLSFDILVSFNRLGEKWGYEQWAWPEFFTYVLLKPGTDPKKVESRFPAFIEKHMSEIFKKFHFTATFHLQPITEIHLKSNLGREIQANGSEREIYFLSLIGAFILLIAWINYINLSTAKSMERAKEVGLRKVVGGLKGQLILQFIFESILVNLFALLAAAIIIVYCMPLFAQFTGKLGGIGLLSSALWHQPWFWLLVFTVFISGSVLVGAYPAFVLSSFKPALVLKGQFNQSNKGISLRKTLVSFQFILSILLIAGTIVVFKQLSFMRNQSLGYNGDQVLVVKGPSAFDSTILTKYDFFKNALIKNNSIKAVTGTTDIPGKTILGRNTIRKASDGKSADIPTNLISIDEHFVNAFKIEMAAGRNFRQQDSSHIVDVPLVKVILNEEAVKILGFKSNHDVVSKEVLFVLGPEERRGEVIGVMKNYHQRSLKEAYDPILFYYSSFADDKYFGIKVNAGDMKKSIAGIEQLYKNVFPGNAFEYFFQNEYFNQQYKSDQRFGNVFGLFTILAIFISCLGLLGLSSFVVKLRTKEIGVRKVLGASVSDILVLFSKDFVKLVMIASVVAIPVTYIMSKRWLGNYAFRIDLSWVIFLIPPLVLLIVTLVTVGLQSFKTALDNPVKSLRSD